MVSPPSPIGSWHRRSWLMANPKRASMREGPLAALFRKTEELEKDESAEQPASEPAPPHGAGPAPVGAVEPVTEAAASVESMSAASQPSAQVEHPRESGVPHPSLRPSIEQDQEAAHIPSPQERLRHAFSSEIPENLMEHPGVTREREPLRDRNAYAYEPQAQEQPRPFGA